MWTSDEMKQRAKQTLQGKYWPILGVSILGGILQGSFFTLLTDIYDPQDGILVLFSNFAMDLHALIRIWITMVILSWIYSIFVGHTIWIGLTQYFFYYGIEYDIVLYYKILFGIGSKNTFRFTSF